MSSGPDRATPSSFGPIIDRLWQTIEQRKTQAMRLDGEKGAEHPDASPSYTVTLLTLPPDTINKKVVEEAAEVVMAAKDYEAARGQGSEGVSPYGTARDHLVYEMGDLLYHVLVLCARYDVTPDDLAAELQRRF